MNDETETGAVPKNLTLNPELSGHWDTLHQLDRMAWLRRADAAIRTLQPVFAPQAVSLRYHDAFHATLCLLSEGSVRECGEINLMEPEA